MRGARGGGGEEISGPNQIAFPVRLLWGKPTGGGGGRQGRQKSRPFKKSGVCGSPPSLIIKKERKKCRRFASAVSLFPARVRRRKPLREQPAISQHVRTCEQGKGGGDWRGGVETHIHTRLIQMDSPNSAALPVGGRRSAGPAICSQGVTHASPNSTRVLETYLFQWDRLGFEREGRRG